MPCLRKLWMHTGIQSFFPTLCKFKSKLYSQLWTIGFKLYASQKAICIIHGLSSMTFPRRPVVRPLVRSFLPGTHLMGSCSYAFYFLLCCFFQFNYNGCSCTHGEADHVLFLCLVLVELKAQCYRAYACVRNTCCSCNMSWSVLPLTFLFWGRVICHELSPTRRFGQQNPE